MREILFKAKRLDNGEWVEGWLVPTMQNTHNDGYIIIDVRGINYDELDYFEPTFISWEIDKDTICQFTGLIDKNGNKIWEKDILSDDDMVSVVRWDEEEARFVIDDYGTKGCLMEYGFDECMGEYGVVDTYGFDDFCSMKSFEVIGNIFDNAELLEK